MLQDAISSVDDYEFEIENALARQLGAKPLPFPGMDKNKAPLCEFFLEGTCIRGSNCPFRHVKGERTIVCKHWLRHLCKKGDDCEFLHEYDMTKMPICYFYQKFGECNNKDCQYLHIDPDSLKIKGCLWYDRGFCKHGPNCRNRHTRRLLCPKYAFGFCPDGLRCKFVHARYDLPVIHQTSFTTFPSTQSNTDHTATTTGSGGTSTTGTDQKTTPGGKQFTRRPLDQVTCFKCGEKGHYANMCPKSYRAMQMGLVGTPAELANNVGVK